jgi:citrate lyase beta subunit
MCARLHGTKYSTLAVRWSCMRQAYDLQAIDTPYIDCQDVEGLRADTQVGMQIRYTGRLVIHPGQIEPIVDVFTPTPEEVERARKLIAAHEGHQKEGVGVFSFEGKMVDQPLPRAAEKC